MLSSMGGQVNESCGVVATTKRLLLKHPHFTHNHWTSAKAFSSEEYFTLYWKEIGIRVAGAFGPDLL
jgi:hypothetical protein